MTVHNILQSLPRYYLKGLNCIQQYFQSIFLFLKPRKGPCVYQEREYSLTSNIPTQKQRICFQQIKRSAFICKKCLEWMKAIYNLSFKSSEKIKRSQCKKKSFSLRFIDENSISIILTLWLSSYIDTYSKLKVSSFSLKLLAKAA